jgi:cation-transporting ATPase E
MVLREQFNTYKNTIEKYAKDYRVIVLAHSEEKFIQNKIPEKVELIGYILILDKIRKEAKNTLEYFKKQGVDIKIISGDNPITVSKIAKQVGIKNYGKYIDMSTIKSDKEIKEIVSQYTIFGRVSPTQKKELVLALQDKGKTVAMTGDGVNDVLALKAADCSIVMANGSDASKNVAQLVLLDSNFASMPKVVAEGRRTINNIGRSASLFLVKTIYSTILALMFLFMGEAYPFVPIQLSLISIITIGIPSFILALEPNREKIKGNFLKNVTARALPTGLTVALNIFVISILHKKGIIPTEQYSSLCVIATGICGLILLFTLSKARKSEETIFPISIFRLSLAIILMGVFICGLIFLNWWFNIAPLEPMLGRIIRIIIISIINFMVLTIVLKRCLKIESEESCQP